MARRKKKSGLSDAIGVLIIVLIGALMAIPKEFWIGLGLLVGTGAVVYFFGKAKKTSVRMEASTPEPAVEVVASRAAEPTPLMDAQIQVEQLRKVMDVPSPQPDSIPVGLTRRSTLPPTTPVAVGARGGESAASQTEFRVPPTPPSFKTGAWVPPGATVQVAGITIPGGMLYVGTSLRARSGSTDPCLIDPSLSVARSGDYTERQMNYWPSYSDISAAARRSYLNWLADGRKDPEADVGFVFLFFYGLERRAIIDANKDEAARADLTAIAAELRRLLAIYGEKSHSFRRYAAELLDWVSLVEHPSRLYTQPVPEFPRTFELPLYVRLALGQAAVDGAAVPAHLAIAWARLEPTIYLRTPATRCVAEFEKLFAEQYRAMFGDGMVLKRNRTKLKLVYRAASSGFSASEELRLTFKDTPDVTALTGPVNALKELVEAATQPLESYSRFVGRNVDGGASLEGLLLLPATLWPESVQRALADLRASMSKGAVALKFNELLATLGANSAFTKERTLALARALESVNLGFEPDVLQGAKVPKPEDVVAVFVLPTAEAASRKDSAYLAASLTLELASAVASADGQFGFEEAEHLRSTVSNWRHLTDGQVQRLLAHLCLLRQAPASLTALKKRLEPLSVETRETIAAFMAAVAQSDGDVSPAEMKMLEKVYKALGVEPKKVFSDVHAAASGAPAAEAVPAKADVTTGFKLDPARIAALQQDTEKVSAMLANIFKEAEEAIPPIVVPAAESEEDDATSSAGTEPGLLGLDEAHSALVRMMLSRMQWSREELLDVATDLDLMLDGALERINEAAFDAHDTPLFEGDDPVTVNADILEKVEP